MSSGALGLARDSRTPLQTFIPLLFQLLPESRPISTEFLQNGAWHSREGNAGPSKLCKNSQPTLARL